MSTRLSNMEEQDISCKSADNVTILVDVTVQYALQGRAARHVFKGVGDDYAVVILLPQLRSAVRDAVAQQPALVVAQSRTTIEDNIRDSLRASLRSTLRNHHIPALAILIDSIQLRNVDLPPSMKESIERIQQESNRGLEAEQALRTASQNAERARIEATSQAAANRISAEGQAAVRAIAGASEAAYYRQVGASMSPSLLEMQRIQMQGRILESPQTRTVILGDTRSSPMLLGPLTPGVGQ